MGLKSIIINQAQKAGDRIAKMSALSPEQVEEIQNLRNGYFELLRRGDPNDPANVNYTKGLLATGSVEIFDAYLPQIKELYMPVDTGSGKSNTVYKILGQAIKNNVHFLVIEPAKGEYKNVFGNMKNVSVYGTNSSIAPLLKINPFSFPNEIHVLEHIDRLTEIFNVCWPMYAAMPAVLKNAIEKAYEDCGWDLVESTNEFGKSMYPNFADIARNVKLIIDNSEYDTDNKGAYKGSLLTRINSLTNGINGLIFAYDEISCSELFDSNVIIDLSRVGSSETKSLIMGMLVLKLQEYRMTSGKMNAELEHLTVLEEAHCLLKRTSTEQSDESSNLLGKSVEMIANAIAEMRTYGEGFIIADQAPGLLDMSVIRNTNTKIIMRLPDLNDRELIGKAANLNDNQITELAKLTCGVAAIYQNEWVQPILCKIEKFDYSESGYVYERVAPQAVPDMREKRLKIAELLSKGTTLSKENIVKDITPVLVEMRIPCSVRAAIFRLLQAPPKEPRMTKLAPIMSALFPNVYKAVEKTYSETHAYTEWTTAAEAALGTIADDQVRRDILQSVVIDYVYNKLGKEKEVKEWIEEGLR